VTRKLSGEFIPVITIAGTPIIMDMSGIVMMDMTAIAISHDQLLPAHHRDQHEDEHDEHHHDAAASRCGPAT
jgi:hypothetical protein